MLKVVTAVIAAMVFVATPARADEIAAGRTDSGSEMTVTATTGNARPDATPVLKTGTGGSGTGSVDPSAKLSCFEIWQLEARKTCAYIAPGEECPETFQGVAGPIVDLCTVVTPTNPAETQQAAARNYAMNYFRSLPLPVPKPKLSATDGITGAVHQLDLQTQQQAIFKDPGTAFGDLIVRCYGTFTVDWGDGTKDTYTTTGAPYPKSSIKHTWTNRGHYAIAVTGQWSADWAFGAYSGTLSGLQTIGTIPDFPVGDLQAVITH